jgi:hypothetical protein
MRYDKYRYVFPPRPKNAVPQSELDFGTVVLWCQPKLNGSNTTIYTNGIKVIVMNRHNQRLTNFRITDGSYHQYIEVMVDGWLLMVNIWTNQKW